MMMRFLRLLCILVCASIAAALIALALFGCKAVSSDNGHGTTVVMSAKP